MEFKRRKSSEHPVPGAQHSPKPRTVMVTSTKNTNSPVRSRPQPKHPVRSSPKQSPFLKQKPVIKDSLPSIAVHSKLSSIYGPSSEQGPQWDSNRGSKRNSKWGNGVKDPNPMELASPPTLKQPGEPLLPSPRHFSPQSNNVQLTAAADRDKAPPDTPKSSRSESSSMLISCG